VNRQKYMAELAGLLSFLSEEERKTVMEYYEKKFDEAGQEGEAALIAELDTPMRRAINLNRNGIDDILGEMNKASSEEETAEEPASEEEQEQLSETEELIHAVMDEKPEAEPGEESRGTDEIEELPAVEEEAEPEQEKKTDENDDVFPELAAALGKKIEVPSEPETKLSVLGLIGFIILAIVPGIPLLAISIVLIPVLLAPVVALGYAGAVGVVAAFKTLSYIPDAMLVFGVTLLIIAAAIFVLLISTWIIGGILKGWFKGVPGLCRRMTRKECR